MGILYKYLNYWSSVLGRGDERRKGGWGRRKAEKHGKKAAFRARGTFTHGRRECHASNKGKSVFLEHKNALGTSNALFFLMAFSPTSVGAAVGRR